MANTRTVLKCLVISPGDVDAERDAVKDGIADFNAKFGATFGVIVEAILWETHATPEMGAEPQAIINRQFADECDLGIAIFWTRIGTATTQHRSGSAEEIARMRARGAPVSVYFSDRPAEPSQIDPVQFAALATLRSAYQKEGLLGSFSTGEELRRKATLRLSSHVTALLANRADDTASARPGFISAPLPDVRVTINVADLYDTARGIPRATFVRINVANHSPQSVFLTGVSFEVNDGQWVITERDSMGGFPMKKVELKSGDSTAYPYVAKMIRVILGKEPARSVVVHDAIGRRFSSASDALSKALARAEEKSAGQ